MVEPSEEQGIRFWTMPKEPRLWEDETVIIVASGPSAAFYGDNYLMQFREDARIIAVNDAYKIVPFADLLYSCDWWWWNNRKMVPEFTGYKAGLVWEGRKGNCYPGWVDSKEKDELYNFASTGQEGLETEDTRGLRTGGNSGYQAINLAVHLGASRILLLGFDCKSDGDKIHFWGNYSGRKNPGNATFVNWKKTFKTLVKPLRDLGIDIINCSQGSALKCFERGVLEREI